MPTLTIADSVLLYVGTLTQANITSIPSGRYSLPMPRMIGQITSDRLWLAGDQIKAGDHLVLNGEFRSAISRHYYAMYHSARAIAFAHHGGDDFQSHQRLPRNLPPALTDVLLRGTQLNDARLLRNQADYDPYPSKQHEWESDARALGVVASDFVNACEDFALTNGHV